MGEILRIAKAWAEAEGRQGALATVIRTHGSTFRRPGARMLILDDGTTTGSVSGGCLESSIIDAAGEVIGTGQSKMLRYDGARDDVVLGEGAMCDGEVAICVERIDGELSESLRLLKDETLEADLLVTITDEPGRGARTRLDTTPSSETGTVIFHERIQASLTVVLCGAGALAEAVGTLADSLGWTPLIVDHRPHFLASMSGRTRELKSGEELDQLLIHPGRTAVVVMTHHFERDCALVSRALVSDAMYVGLLGSRGRSARVLDEVRRGIPSVDSSRLRAPVGLEIGSETIEEIALSIVAEIQAVRRGSGGGPLMESDAPVHGRRSARVAAVILAAGESTRMGESKLMMPGPGGRPMIAEIIERCRELDLVDLVVVTGADGEVAEIAKEHRARVIVNDDWREGMGSSLREGIAGLGEDIDAAMILVGDQPNITRRDLELLRDRWREGSRSVIATRYPEGGGAPAIFDRSLFDELRSLQGDRGAKDLIRSLDDVDLVEVSDARDVDDPESYDRIVGSSRETIS